MPYPVLNVNKYNDKDIEMERDKLDIKRQIETEREKSGFTRTQKEG